VGTAPAVYTFDAEAALADLDSPEASLLDGSIVVLDDASDLLTDLRKVFVSMNLP
jgi:hypothetical protein